MVGQRHPGVTPGLRFFQIPRRTYRGIQSSSSKFAPSASSEKPASSSLSTTLDLSPPTVAPSPSAYDIISSPLVRLDSKVLQFPTAAEPPISFAKAAINSEKSSSRNDHHPVDLARNKHVLASLSKIARISAKLLEQSQSWNAQLQHVRDFKVTETSLRRTAVQDITLKAATLDLKKECDQTIEALLALRQSLIVRLEMLHPGARYVMSTTPKGSAGSEVEPIAATAELASRSGEELSPSKATLVSKGDDQLDERDETKRQMRLNVETVPKVPEKMIELRKKSREDASHERETETIGDGSEEEDADWTIGKPGRLHELHMRIKERMNSELMQDKGSDSGTSQRSSEGG